MKELFEMFQSRGTDWRWFWSSESTPSCQNDTAKVNLTIPMTPHGPWWSPDDWGNGSKISRTGQMQQHNNINNNNNNNHNNNSKNNNNNKNSNNNNNMVRKAISKNLVKIVSKIVRRIRIGGDGYFIHAHNYWFNRSFIHSFRHSNIHFLVQLVACTSINSFIPIYLFILTFSFAQ